MYYPAKYVLPSFAEKVGVKPPMEVATEASMDPLLKNLSIDLTGIWWMSGNPVHEELVSFANTKVNLTNGGFPATLSFPMNKKGMWSWLTTAFGTILRKFYGATRDPELHREMVFQSPTDGTIDTGLTDVPLVWVESYPLHKYALDCDATFGSENCDPTDCAPKEFNGTCADLIRQYPHDIWSRPTRFQEGSLFSATTYTLKRIVMGDGSPHPVFWAEFMQYMTEDTTECEWSWFGPTCTTKPGVRGERQMQSYRSNNWCERKQSAMWPLSVNC